MEPKLNAEARHLRSQLAAAKQHNRPEAEALSSEFKALRPANYIKALVDSAPPLTTEQRDRLAVLLRGGAA